jgi:hypothetical protein
LKTLTTWNIDGRLLEFTKNIMNDRTLRVAIDNTMSSFKNIENGVPQRAVLCVTLFLVAWWICDKIEEPTKILGYAHDWVLVFYTSRRIPRMAENELQKSAKKIMKWANETGLTISEKTKTLLVLRRRPRVQSRPTLNIWMGEYMLVMVRHNKILGLIFDEKLIWKEHLKTVKARTSKKLNLLRIPAHKE